MKNEIYKIGFRSWEVATTHNNSDEEKQTGFPTRAEARLYASIRQKSKSFNEACRKYANS